MKRAIFKNFIIIISLALLLSGSIFSTLISNILLGKTRENMIDLLQIIDQSLDYSEDIKSQIDNLLAINQRNKSRITVMDIMGNVVADSDISDYNNIDNHLNREEIQEALKAGIGYAKRKSNTRYTYALCILSFKTRKLYTSNIHAIFRSDKLYGLSPSGNFTKLRYIPNSFNYIRKSILPFYN